MARVNVRFFDDELLEGEVRELDFDQPDFLLEVDDTNGLENNERAWVPLSAVKWVAMPTAAANGSGSVLQLRKVAVRFIDGEVMRGHMDGHVERHRYALVLTLHPEEPASPADAAEEIEPARRLAIPFNAIKAIFYVRNFDGRIEDDQGAPSEDYLARRTMAPLIDVLEEMDMLQRLHRGGLLTDSEYESKRTQVLERL
jgi:hypothetical protein